MVQLRAKIQNDRRYFWALVCFILVFAFILRLPYVSSGLPYFYHEDEAHHFNRVVRMTQKGEYNPEYFHKPSLHFYLRMPVVAASFLWSVKKGEIRSIQEVKTEDPYGLGDYNFTASHPRLVRWSRMLSVLLAVGLVAGAMKVSWLLIPAWPLMAATGLLTAVAPGLVSQSAVIGVDMPMAFFAILSVIFSLDFFRTKAYRYLFWAAVCAGLSTSSKYNALPICVLPLVTIVVSRALRWKNLVTSLLVPIGAFFAASPFILVSLPLFLDQFAYEIWHYGVAGHQGHMATPGFEQAGFYLNWIVADGVGLVGLVLAFLGALYFLLRLEREAVVAFSFPLLLFILMCLQKTNFTRNLLALLPFVSLLVVFGLFALVDISKRFVSEQRVPLVAGTFFLGVFFQPFLTASQVSMRALSLKDSRTEAVSWLHQADQLSKELAIAGQLQLPRFTNFSGGVERLSRLGVERVDETLPLEEFWLNGFDQLAFSSSRTLSDFEASLVRSVHTFEGTKQAMRVVQNPAIQIFEFREGASNPLRKTLAPFESLFSIKDAGLTCQKILPEEEHCWQKTRLVGFTIEKKLQPRIEVMTPWLGQHLKIWKVDMVVSELEFTQDQIGKWLPLELPELEAGSYVLEVRSVRVPATQELSEDRRRLGVAFR